MLTREETNRFAEKFLDALQHTSAEVYAHTSTSSAVRGEEYYLFFVYDGNGKNICTNANRLYLYQNDVVNSDDSTTYESAMTETTKLYAKAMSEGVNIDLGEMKYTKSRILPIILNKEYISSNIEKEVSGEVKNTDLAYAFVHADAKVDDIDPITLEEFDILFNNDIQKLKDTAMQNAMEQLGLHVVANRGVRNILEARNAVFSLTDDRKSIFSALGILVFLRNICSITHCPVYVLPIAPDKIYAIPKVIGGRKKVHKVYDKLMEIKEPAQKGLFHLSDKIYLYDPTTGFATIN